MTKILERILPKDDPIYSEGWKISSHKYKSGDLSRSRDFPEKESEQKKESSDGLPGS